jgi:hypothetical protein
MKPKLTKVPSLDACANDLDAHRLGELPRDVVARLAERIGIAKVKIDLALALGANGAKPDDRPLSVEEAAALCGTSAKWIRYQSNHNRAWSGFVHRLSRKKVLFDRAGLEGWLASRRA